jgi:Ca2+-binding EF-hand superfamily protein
MNLLPTLPIMPVDAVESYFEDEKRREEEVSAMSQTLPISGFGKKSVTLQETPAKGGVHEESGLKCAGDSVRGSGHSGSFKRSASFVADNAAGIAKHLTEQRKDMRKRTSVFEVVRPSQKISINRKAACDALRLFVFGYVGNENINPDDQKARDMTYYETGGTAEQVETLGTLWHSLDKDGSGWVDIAEFREFLQMKGLTKQQREWGERTVSLLLGKKSSFCIEDMMRILWPCAPLNELLAMTSIVEESKSREQAYIPPPVVIPAEDRDALKHIFKHVDKEGKGVVTFQMIANAGLLDKVAVQQYIDEWDPVFHSDGTLTLEDFIAMLCPVGYRAAEDARIACDAEGNIIYLEGKMWKRKITEAAATDDPDEEENELFLD